MAKGTCSVVNSEGTCRRPILCKGMCVLHYGRMRNRGTTEPRYMPTTEERFWAKVNKDGPVPVARPDLGACWIWTAALTYGYGRFAHGDHRCSLAHRFAYELLIGLIPDGLQLDHLCRTPACVNPEHLEPVTGRVNVLRGNTFAAEQSARTHCPQGHEYDEANTYTDAKNHRHCRRCRREQEAERRRLAKAAA